MAKLTIVSASTLAHSTWLPSLLQQLIRSDWDLRGIMARSDRFLRAGITETLEADYEGFMMHDTVAGGSEDFGIKATVND